MTFTQLIRLVAQRLAYEVPEAEIAEGLVSNGYDPMDAFLAIRAGQLYLKYTDEVAY